MESSVQCKQNKSLGPNFLFTQVKHGPHQDLPLACNRAHHCVPDQLECTYLNTLPDTVIGIKIKKWISPGLQGD